MHFLTMSDESRAIVQALRTVLVHRSQHPYPHVPTPENCTKRASVAAVIRVRPAFAPVVAASGSVVDVENPSPSPPATLEEFFSQEWVQQGDPELLFIKRAGRAGDRWSGHTALPGGKRDPEDADDLAAAVRETREETGLDLDTAGCLHAGNLPDRLVSTAWGKETLMVLCPYIFVLTSKTSPALQPQPTEVAALHWVSLRALLSPTLRTREFVDISSRMAKHVGPVVHKILRFTMGRMMFSAVRLVPSESVYASSIPGFIPTEGGDKLGTVSGWAQAPYGVPDSSTSLAFQQPILLWGLTLGVLADLLDQLPPYNAVALWKYPTFTVPDLRFLVYLFTRTMRRDTASLVSSGSWPNQTALDAMTQATTAATVTEAEPIGVVTASPSEEGDDADVDRHRVGIGGLGVGSDPKRSMAKIMAGYYDKINVAIGVFLAYRTLTALGLGFYAYRFWQRRKGSLL